jgi:DNA-binding MarR family transcriptional regulator
MSEIDPARLVGILDRLEADGLVQRRRHPGDRRVRSLAVTDKAKPVLRLIWSVISETYVEALQDLSTDEIRIMVTVLESIRSNLSACKPLCAGDAVGNKVTARRRLRLVR